MLTGLRWRQWQHLQRWEGLELWKALAVNWHNHASSALGIRELPQTLIQVQTLIHGLGMESSMGLAKVHTHTWPKDRSTHVGHRVATLPGSSTHSFIKEQSYPQIVSYLTWLSLTVKMYKDLHLAGWPHQDQASPVTLFYFGNTH